MPGFRQKLPLHVLPAFEAAARHGSFRAAAAELHLTPSAISHQIRSLEASIGVPLFARLTRRLELTEAGRRYAASVADVLGRLEAATNALAPVAGPKRVSISVPDFVAHLYVLPALSRFRERHPLLDLEISATMELADLARGKVDAAVRIGLGSWNGLRAYMITPLGGTVVAAPALAARAADARDRKALPIVCLNTLEDHTREVLQALGLCSEPERVLCVDNYMAVVQAATEGLGVALVYAPPSKPHEFDGKLLPLSDGPMTAPFAAYFVCRTKDAEREDLALLREWLTDCIPN